MTDSFQTREKYITQKLWSYFSKTIAISVVTSMLTHLLGYPPKLRLAYEWGIPDLIILFIGNFIIKRNINNSAGKYLLIIITTVVVFIGLWVTPSPYLFGFLFITLVFSVFYLNQWVTVLAIVLNVLSGIILVFTFRRINTMDGRIVDSMNIFGTYVVIGILLYILSKELRQTIQERAAAREIQDILSLGSDDGIILIDNDYKVADFKDYLADPIFAANEDMVLHQDIMEMEWLEPLIPILKERKNIHSEEIEVAINGKTFPCLFSCFATKTSGKIRAVVLFRNINKQRQIEQQLERAAKWALTGDIAAGLAHEIRNPLTVVTGYLQLMQGRVGSNYEQYISSMLDETDRANHLLTDFLYISKPQPLEFVDYNLKKLIIDVKRLIYPAATLKGVALQTPTQNSLLLVRIDVRQFKQVLLNMLKNAVEATQPGGTVSISAGMKNGAVTLEISDTGKGISKEHLPKIFDAFFTTKDEGTGLGLAVSYRILRDHGCTVDVESTEGLGTKFMIHFPAYK